MYKSFNFVWLVLAGDRENERERGWGQIKVSSERIQRELNKKEKHLQQMPLCFHS